VSSPDYQTVDRDHAIEDFKDRIKVYETQYHTLDEDHDKNLSFIKIYNQGERYLVNNISGMQAAACLCAFVVETSSSARAETRALLQFAQLVELHLSASH